MGASSGWSMLNVTPSLPQRVLANHYSEQLLRLLSFRASIALAQSYRAALLA